MRSEDRRQLIERIVAALAAHDIEVELDSTLMSDIIAAIEWGSVVISDEEWGDIRQMAEKVEFLMSIVTEWGWLQ